MAFGRRLDLVNFLLADVRGGLGPYVGIFLLGQAHWDQATIGLVLTVSGLVGISLHAPIGALIDATRHKRALLVAGVAALAAGAIAIAEAPTLPVVLAADIVMAVLGAVFAPTVAAITVGLVAREQLAARLARNAACDRAGNIFAAAVAGLAGWALSHRSRVLPDPAVCGPEQPSRCCRFRRPRSTMSGRAALDGARLEARAARRELARHAAAPPVARAGRRHGAVPLRQRADPAAARPWSWSGASRDGRRCYVGRGHHGAAGLDPGGAARRCPRRPLGPQAAAAAWPRRPAAARAALRADRPPGLARGRPVLDGISLGTLDALLALVLADIMRGTGRYNAARGVVGTVQGIGGSASNVAAGLLVVGAGNTAAFLALATVGMGAVALVRWKLPETAAGHGS